MNVKNLMFEDKSVFNDYFLENEEMSLEYLPKINSINILIGVNNSGKSIFMRNLMSIKKFLAVDSELLLKYNHEVVKLNERNVKSNHLYELKNKILIEQTIYTNSQILKNNYGTHAKETILFTSLFSNLIKEFKTLKRYYIPTLRTAHSLFEIKNNTLLKSLLPEDKYQKIEEDIYLHTYLKNYSINENIEIFTGLHLYREILNARNSKRETRLRFDGFQDFISENFFNSKKIDIVAKLKKEDTLKGKNHDETISIDIDGDEKDLHYLGDGIQAIIILMYKIFMAEDDSFFFIDEPELNLHPGMQRLFLEQIISNEDLKKKNLTYFITTHSNHFLDLTIEQNNVSIYSFSPRVLENGKKQFVIKNVNAGDNELLRNLGVNNSSVFMANCSIWVEGISDRNYIKAFLKSYCDYHEDKPYPKEDIDFAFFEYAGSNIDHYIFDEKFEKEDENIVIKDIQALAVSNRIFLLADSDATTKTDKSKFERLENLEKAKSDNFTPKICWNIREIENLITNEMWKEVLINFCNKTLVKSEKETIKERISEALLEVNANDYSKKYIGEFLEELRNKTGKIASTYILNQSIYEVKKNAKEETSYGTFVNKRELSELVFKQNFSWKVLSENKEIENLTIEIYNFITNK